METVPALLMRGMATGIGATLAVDLWALALQRFAGARAMDWALVGRWLGHMPRGRFRHAAIGTAAPVRGERVLGWGFHYLTGIVFAIALFAAMGPDWAAAPTLLPCVSFGVLTVAFPFLLMQPGIGAGIAASRTPQPMRSRLRSLTTHTVFGLGLHLSAMLVAHVAR